MATPREPVNGPHVLIISHDAVDLRMAGPGIRYWELARLLAQHVPVTLAVPGNTALDAVGFALQIYQRDDGEALFSAAERSDVIMPCGNTLVDFPALADAGKPLIIDGYDPFTVESLARLAGEALEKQRAVHSTLLSLLRQQCLMGDFFICASERQRNWWLGLLEAHGRINPQTFSADPTLRQLVDIVPFGLPSRPPEHARPVLKGVVPGIGPDDKVILWGGGIWEWLDPLTLIQAMPEIVKRRPDVRLVFPGPRHPDTELAPEMPIYRRTMQLARESDLRDRYVFFGHWVDYGEWQNYLMEADIGVSLHLDTLEARLAFRSRVLDYVWAGLPMVVTRGDATSEMVAQHGLGVLVDFADVNGVAEAVLEVLDADPELQHARFGEVQAALTWERMAEPLVAFCRNPHHAADRQEGRGEASACLGLVQELQARLKHREKELARLRSLVAGYESGRFIRLMSWWHDLRVRR
jgi:glycosyltransferase involved in cell wall biosynthesis